jgi:hypothetical protein
MFKIMTSKLACANCASNSMYPSKDCMLQFLLLPSMVADRYHSFFNKYNEIILYQTKIK